MGIIEEHYGDGKRKKPSDKKPGEYDFSNFFPRPPEPTQEQIIQENFIKMMLQKEKNGTLVDEAKQEAKNVAASSGLNLGLNAYELQGTFYIGQHPADITKTVLDLAYDAKLVIAAKYCTDPLLVKTEEAITARIKDFLRQNGRVIYSDKGAMHATQPTVVIDSANFKETDLEEAIFRLIEFGDKKSASNLFTVIFQPDKAKKTAIYQVLDEKTAAIVGAGASIMSQSGNFSFVEIKKLKL